MSRYTIIGGDLRNLELAKELINSGSSVDIYGFSKIELPSEIVSNKTMEESINNSDVLILPIIVLEDNKHINTPYGDTKIEINDVISLIKFGQTVIGGKINDNFKDVFNDKEIKYINILDNEEMAVLNAVVTAESAIGLAIYNTQITLNQNNSMVLGFGRIGKNLSKMLQGIGRNVYVGVRKKEDLAWIRGYNYTGIALNKIGQSIGKMDVIFNTIPKRIMDSETLAKINKQTLIVDLASGFDEDTINEFGLRVVKAKGLPGKMASKTSAKIMKEVIYGIEEKR